MLTLSDYGVTIVYKRATEMYRTKKLNIISKSTLSIPYIIYIRLYENRVFIWEFNKN